MSQPKWKCVANLGDVNPIEYGGAFVFIDTTGVYCPEMEVLTAPEEHEKQEWAVHRLVLDPCTFEDGILSDNHFHPDHPAWFADDVNEHVRGLLIDPDPKARGMGYLEVFNMHAPANFDDDPLKLTMEGAEKRYRKAMRELKNS